MENFHVAAAAIVDALGLPHFNDVMFDACQSLIKFDNSVILAFDARTARPSLVAIYYTDPEFEEASKLYLEKYFEDCEMIQRLKEMSEADSVSLIRQSTQEIADPEYRRDLFESPHIAHDMMLLEKVGSTFFSFELLRSEGGEPFTEEDEKRVKEFWPFALSCIQKNQRLAKLTKSTPSSPRDQLSSLIKMFLDKGVSQREAEVCSHIALGYSTLATSLHLSVSVNTIATLRQRAYKKLGISCMNELYSLCLRSFGTMLENTDVDWEFFENSPMVLRDGRRKRAENNTSS